MRKAPYQPWRRQSLFVVCILLLGRTQFFAASADYDSAQRKMKRIESGKVPRGGVVVFTARELTAYGIVEAEKMAPNAFWQPRLELRAGGATAYALIDFVKLRRGGGHQANWFLDRLLAGERPLTVAVRMESAKGRATVHVERVEISSLAVTGGTLDFLMTNFLLPVYPRAKINEPFELGNGMERIEVVPGQARVVMKK